MSRFVPFLLLFLALGHARADTFPVARAPSREPQPYKHDAAAVSRLPRPFLEETPAVVLYAGTSHLVEPDGTVETITHEVTRLNSRRGIEKYGEFRGIFFDPSYQKLTLNEARVLKKDGRIIPVEPWQVHLRDASTDFQVYDSSKQLILSFPNLEAGDTYDVKWTVRGRNVEFDGQFFTRYTFGDDTVPVVLDELHVSLPKTTPFHHASINGAVEVERRDDKTRKHFHWRVRERWPLVREEDRPSRETLKLQVLCSTFRDWEAVAAWKEKLRKGCWECSDEIRKVVEEVTKDLATPQEKARALTYWVRGNIRYLSRGPAGTGYTPHTPAKVLKHLFGDCKDQAQLLAVMLREVGLDPYLVTLGVLDDGQVVEEVPCPWGTHAILMVPIGDQQHWIDTTVNMAPWDWLPRSDRDRQAYLTRRDEIRLLRTPPYTTKDNRIEQATFVAVQGDGSSLCTRSMFYHGGVALGRRESWVDATNGERRRFLTNELQDAFPTSKLDVIDIPERILNDWDQSVQAQLRFVIPRHFTGNAAREASVTDSAVWTRIIAYKPDHDRTLPLNLSSPFESLHLYVIQLPPAFRFDGVPSDREVSGKWGTFKLTVKRLEKNPRRLELVMHTKLKETMVDPKDFSAFQKYTEELSKAYRVWLNIRPTSEIDDAPLLETLLAIAPGSDAFAAKTLARLYLENDRRRDARRVLAEASAYHPEDAEVWTLRLKLAADDQEKESIHAALSRYYPEEPKHALALAGMQAKRGEIRQAGKSLGKLTRHESRDIQAKAFLELARLYETQKQYGPALLHFEAAWQLDQSAVADGASLLFASGLHEKRGNRDEAIRVGSLAHKLEPDNTEVLAFLVRLEIAAGKKLDALDHLRRMVLAAKNDIATLTQAGELYLQLGRIDEAYDIAMRAREAGFQGGVQRLLGLIHFQKQDYEKAAFHLDRGDLDALALETLIEARVAGAQLPEAYRLLDTASRLPTVPDSLKKWDAELRGLAKRHKHLTTLLSDPGSPPSPEMLRAINCTLCAEHAWRRNQPREHVKRLVEQGLAEKIELAPLFSMQALLHLEQGAIRKASEDLERAFRLAPGDALAFYVRGRIRFEKAEPTAVDDLVRAVALSGESNPIMLHWLATALHHAGRHDEAIVAQRKAVALRPEDRELTTQLAQFERAKTERAP